MTINKYQGKTKEEAIEKAKQELGAGVVVLNVKEIKPKGVLKALKGSVFEVTAAMEEKEKFVSPVPAAKTIVSHNINGNSTAGSDTGIAANSNAAIRGSINLVTDETVTIPKIQHMQTEEKVTPVQGGVSPMKETSGTNEGLEKRLENLSNILEKQLAVDGARVDEKLETQTNNPEGFQFVKMLYRTLLENDVNEKYVNQMMEEAEKVLHNGSSVDYILSNVYQKLILKFEQPDTIDLSGKKPKIIFFIGPTGVGKTTTLAKIASMYKVEKEKKVAFLTADTYRIAATEQLRIYANILDAPMSIIYTDEEMNAAIERAGDYDLIFVDTAGFSHRNEAQCSDMKKLINGLNEEYEKEVYLVLSATTKYKDLIEMADIYKEIADYKLIFTKLDETTTYGNILNVKLYSGAKLSYMTTGQNVPDDIEVFDTQKIVKQLLGGR